jgi:hypothetical protein
MLWLSCKKLNFDTRIGKGALAIGLREEAANISVLGRADNCHLGYSRSFNEN